MKKFYLFCLFILSFNISNAIAKPMASTSGMKVRSIKEWGVACNSTSDETEKLRSAISDASDNSFVLLVDCPVNIKIGMDITKPIFIDNNTIIKFSEKGIIYVDNQLIPAFVIANTHDVNLQNWRVKYNGGIPLSPYTTGYYDDGVWVNVDRKVMSPPSLYFINQTLSNWLTVNRQLVFNRGYSFSTGLPDPYAIFYIKGDSYNLAFTNMNVSTSSPFSQANKYIPLVFALVPDYVNGTTVYAQQARPYSYEPPVKKPYVQVPHDLIFNNIRLDGFYHGWHGSVQDAEFYNIKSYHYSTLQDSNGNNIGGLNKYFAPPHLFYLNDDSRFDASLYNKNIKIKNVYDYGIRVGKAEDTKVEKNIAGAACSLKLQVINGIVDNYTSNRPDGFLVLLSSKDVIFSNITASYDSKYLDNLFPSVRFTSIENYDKVANSYINNYKNITFKNLVVTDIAPYTYMSPITGNRNNSNEKIRFYDTKIKVNSWLSDEPLPFNPESYIDKQGYLNDSYFKGKNNIFQVKTSFNNDYKIVSKYGIIVEKSDSIINGRAINNTLQNIALTNKNQKVFGLLFYQIRNTNTKMVKLKIQSAGSLPSGIDYYSGSWDNLCVQPNGSNIINIPAGMSCNLILRYTPSNASNKNDNGILLYQILQISDKGQELKLPLLKIPYSARIIKH